MNKPHRCQEAAAESDELYQPKSNQFNIWQRAIYQEVEKRKAVETQLELFKSMCQNYAVKMSTMEDLLWRTKAAEKEIRDESHNLEAEEEVQSNFNPSCRLQFDGMCSLCKKRMANIVLIPCRHLCFCSDCDHPTAACLICHTHRITSFKVNRV